MKKPILLAASLGAAISTASLTALANKAMADPMFQVTAASPGAVTFSGTGTAQFNNSVGTNNSFQVGSNTNLGVNASSSSTPEYITNSNAKLDLAGTSTMVQTIGTSGTYKEATSAYSAASTAAASTTVSYMADQGWSSSYQAGNKGYSTQASWEAAYKAAYDAKYSTEYSTAYSAQATTRQSVGTDGTISGSFRTVESGSARASGSAADWGSSATAKANASIGSSWGGSSSGYSTQAAWQAAWDSSYNTAYAQASSASNRFSDSAVTVKGIGSDAKIQAASTSTFEVDVTARSGVTGSSTATANGSAGANLATSSFANQSQSSTASAFMQAFGRGT